MSKALSRICLTVVMPASGRKKPKWSGKSLSVQAMGRWSEVWCWAWRVLQSVARGGRAVEGGGGDGDEAAEGVAGGELIHDRFELDDLKCVNAD